MTNQLPVKLTELRKHFGYTQGELAEKLEVPVSVYMNWENGNAIPNVFQLRFLSSLYKVPMEELADNTRKLNLPRTDTDDDSVQISFGVNAANHVYKTEVQASLGDTVQTSALSKEESSTKQFDTSAFAETQVNTIVDDDDDEDEDEEEEPKRKPSKKSKETKEKKPTDKNKIGIIIAGAVVGVLAIVLCVIFLGGNKKSSGSVSLSDDNRLALGDTFSLYLSGEGNLSSLGTAVPSLNQEDVVQVSAYSSWAMGLKNDGTVVLAGNSSLSEAENWEDIVMIAAGDSHAVGLHSDGTVECVGSSSACEVTEWTDINKVYAGKDITVGVATDGTTKVSGDFSSSSSVAGLTGIKDVSFSDDSIIIVKNDGTVSCYATGTNATVNTASWTGVSKAVVGDGFAAALSGGNVMYVGDDEDVKEEVESWSNVKYLAANGDTLVAVTSSGSLIGAGDNSNGVYQNDAEPTASATTTTETKLSSVTNIKFSVSSSQLTITWDAVTNADYYTVKVNTSPETNLKSEKTSASVSTDRLVSGTAYTVMITACTKDGDIASSDVATTTYTFQPSLTKLPTPTGVSATLNGTKLVVSWTKVDNAAGYTVAIQDASQNVTDTTAEFDFSSNTSGTYTILVTANAKSGDNRYTTSDAATYTYNYTVPTTPLATTSVVSTATDESSITITWTKVEGAANYTITLNGVSYTTANGDELTHSFDTSTWEAGKTYTLSYTIVANPSDTTKNTASKLDSSVTYEKKAAETPTPTPTPSATATAEGTGGDTNG